MAAMTVCAVVRTPWEEQGFSLVVSRSWNRIDMLVKILYHES